MARPDFPSRRIYIYGQFIEHIGDLINRRLWAEMLDDRKLYNDIISKLPKRGRGRAGRCFGRGGRQTACLGGVRRSAVVQGPMMRKKWEMF